MDEIIMYILRTHRENFNSDNDIFTHLGELNVSVQGINVTTGCFRVQSKVDAIQLKLKLSVPQLGSGFLLQ